MAIFYFAGAFLGVALHELCCIGYFLGTNIAARPKNLKQPLFQVSLATYIAQIISFVAQMCGIAFNTIKDDLLANGAPLAESNTCLVFTRCLAVICLYLFICFW